MGRKITVSIQADVEVIATEEEEKIIKKIEDLDYTAEEYDDLYDELTDKLEGLIAKRLEGNLKDVTVLDTNW